MKKIILTMLICFLLSTTAAVSAWEGHILRILDGDTVVALNANKKLVRIRLYGVDVPEKKQPYGQESKRFTVDLVKGGLSPKPQNFLIAINTVCYRKDEVKYIVVAGNSCFSLDVGLAREILFVGANPKIDTCSLHNR